MKWQKNTGVMPCGKYETVSTRDINGAVRLFKYRAELVNWKETNLNRTYYIHQVDGVPENDYVEPKVWTVESMGSGDFIIRKNGKTVYRIAYVHHNHTINELEDALNAMEERK